MLSVDRDLFLYLSVILLLRFELAHRFRDIVPADDCITVEYAPRPPSADLHDHVSPIPALRRLRAAVLRKSWKVSPVWRVPVHPHCEHFAVSIPVAPQ
jgi:hypothetical protein